MSCSSATPSSAGRKKRSPSSSPTGGGRSGQRRRTPFTDSALSGVANQEQRRLGRLRMPSLPLPSVFTRWRISCVLHHCIRVALASGMADCFGLFNYVLFWFGPSFVDDLLILAGVYPSISTQLIVPWLPSWKSVH